MNENLRDKIEAAWREVERLCDGGRWQMTVPVDQRRDSDIIIGDALKAASDALAERDVLRAALAKVEALADGWANIPAYDTTAYDQGRVDQRRMATEELLAALASVPEPSDSEPVRATAPDADREAGER